MSDVVDLSALEGTAVRAESERTPRMQLLAPGTFPRHPPPPPRAHQELYRRRFESSVFGEHAMLPPPEILQHMKSKEEPAAYPSGPNTSFHNLTPMPHRFTDGALDQINTRHAEAKEVHPCYHTSSKEIGALPYSSSDLPMRWYGRTGNFTGGWVAEPKTKVNSGLNTGMDR